ncbi:MAG: DUF167 domain-containing protein [Desulfurococcales archaeon]|nr:DUF167 domain-containing protein [Desulfurococcales archaeon]
MDCSEAISKLVIRDRNDCILKIQVHPSSKRDGILYDDGYIVVHVTSPPLGGKANEDIARLFKKKLRVKAIIESGFKSRDKTVRVHGVDCGELARKICRGAG